MKNIIIISILLFLSLGLFAQDRQPMFLGLQPSLTKEKFYDKNEFDINLIPLVFQTPIGKRVDIRLTTLANYHFGSEQAFSDIGLQLLLPVYLKSKEETKMVSDGIYLGPVIDFGRNLINDHYTTTLALEPGYMLKASKSFALSIGLQLGASYFMYDSQPNKWVSHFGVKINLGFWVNKE